MWGVYLWAVHAHVVGALQIEELHKSIRELRKTRVQKERMFEREKLEFRKELDTRLKEIETLKRNSEKVKARMQVCRPTGGWEAAVRFLYSFVFFRLAPVNCPCPD